MASLHSTRRLVALLITVIAVAITLPAQALAHQQSSALAPAVQSDGTQELLTQLATEYQGAFTSHNEAAATHARGMARAAQTLAASVPSIAGAQAPRLAAQLTETLAPTSFTLQIWPFPDQVQTLATKLKADLSVQTAAMTKLPTASTEVSDLAQAANSEAAGHHATVAAGELAEAYAVFTQRLATRLNGVAPELVTKTDSDMWRGINASTTHPAALTTSTNALDSDITEDEAALGQIKVSRATIVSDAAIILFREGLEAVLILAAITASFTGARRKLRRPVMIGAAIGFVATVATYVLAQAILDAVGDSGLRLQAITGLLAIGVLLIVTNWFFHKVYWSEWIARFNRRRKVLEQVDRLGFISGQTLGFVMLGATSVYREGFETVLFLQNLQVSAGTGATLLGVAIGLAATLTVGTITFVLGRKLPYKRMLIATGVMISIVLAVMVGTTVNNLQGLGWVPTTQIGFTIDPRLSQWLGLYATWEGIGAQVAALAVVYGSYIVARQMQFRRRRTALAQPALATD